MAELESEDEVSTEPASDSNAVMNQPIRDKEQFDSLTAQSEKQQEVQDEQNGMAANKSPFGETGGNEPDLPEKEIVANQTETTTSANDEKQPETQRTDEELEAKEKAADNEKMENEKKEKVKRTRKRMQANNEDKRKSDRKTQKPDFFGYNLMITWTEKETTGEKMEEAKE